MTKAEFDEFAQSFVDIAGKNASFFGGDYSYFGRYRSNIIKQVVGSNVGSILDFGCGIGLGVTALREVFPNSKIVGCDPSEDSLAIARTYQPECEFLEPNALAPTSQFNIITAVNVLHHIAPAGRESALQYCYERLKRGGTALSSSTTLTIL